MNTWWWISLVVVCWTVVPLPIAVAVGRFLSDPSVRPVDEHAVSSVGAPVAPVAPVVAV